MADRRQRVGLAALAAVLAGCEPAVTTPDSESVLQRTGRFGSLRDFVLVETGDEELFIDRFEVTRGDWTEFAATPEGQAVLAAHAEMHDDPALPVGGVDLRMARAFAAWRFARLPRLDEWRAAALGDGSNRFPWGAKPEATRANTLELGLFRPTLCGTFESGRRGNGPYDLVGNVGEWTETVAAGWFAGGGGDWPEGVLYDPAEAAQRHALAARALGVWQLLPGVMSPVAVIAAGGPAVPRVVVGADFQSSMLEFRPSVLEVQSSTSDVAGELVAGGDRRSRTGLRLLTTPRELLQALWSYDDEPSRAEYRQLERFLARARHRAVLRRAHAASGLEAKTALARWLATNLAGPP